MKIAGILFWDNRIYNKPNIVMTVRELNIKSQYDCNCNLNYANAQQTHIVNWPS